MHLLAGSVAAAALMAAWQFCIPVASAQDPSLSPPPGLSNPAPDISDQKLDAAATALARVASLKQEYLQRLQAATASDKERIADEANNALTRAVEDQGLTVEEYNSIIVVAQNDPGVREKILQRLRPAGQDQEQPGPHQ